jgi:single-stranded-DNA-specific exonuclease
MEIKNLKKAAQRIFKALNQKEKIILYGDSDPDGVGSVILLKETLEKLAKNFLNSPLEIIVYFPDRIKEGYGLNETALKFLSQFSPALFITLDLGIGNVKEVELAKKLGFEVIIIDHHEPLLELPKAEIIVDPKQKDDKYPFKNFSCTALVYKLVKLLHNLGGIAWESERFLELVLLATLYDQMPIVEENEKLVKEGILAFNYSKRVSLNVLKKLTNFQGSLEEVKKKILPPLSAATTTPDHLQEAYIFLTEESSVKAEELGKNLIEKNRKRNEEIKKVFQEVEARVAFFREDPIIFEGSSNWSVMVLGPVASKIAQKYQKPTFLFEKGEKESRGAVRMPEGFDAVKAMINCSNLLITFGGHPLAAGFKIKNENLESFRECLCEYFKKN